ncbi:MAG: Fur family transcriptional regulator, ferric uptake regulator [Actinomycetota bacterium]|jgi:Fe2+ or Zn2+ uptake regulation protein
MATTHDLDAEVAALLRRVGQRFTSGRRAMLAALVAFDRPVTITELLSAAPGLPASSAYRHLAVLEQAGVVHRIVLGGEEHARFELAEALTDHHHHHLICSNCGAVDDFTVPAKLERAVADALDEVAANTGFKATEHRFDLIGLCARCSGSSPHQ